jgi:hypothetical protein
MIDEPTEFFNPYEKVVSNPDRSDPGEAISAEASEVVRAQSPIIEKPDEHQAAIDTYRAQLNGTEESEMADNAKAPLQTNVNIQKTETPLERVKHFLSSIKKTFLDFFGLNGPKRVRSQGTA